MTVIRFVHPNNPEPEQDPTWPSKIASEPPKPSKEDVLKAYEKYLSYTVLKALINNTREETHEEISLRLDAMSEFNALELQHVASFVK